jgi:hypothetical protein
MSRYDHIKAVLSAVHDSGLIGATAVELCEKHGFVINRCTASLYSLWRNGAVRRCHDSDTGHFRYWYAREHVKDGDVLLMPPALPPALPPPEASTPTPDVFSVSVPIRADQSVSLSVAEARALYKNLAALFAGT